MKNRIELLEEAYALVSQYTTTDYWRPSITDLMVYDIMIDWHQNDEDSYIWYKKPDEVMQHIIDQRYIFDLQYGLEQLDEEIRDYLLNNNFIKSLDDVDEEEEE